MMFQEELVRNRRQQMMITLLVTVSIICALSFVARSMVSSYWLEKKDSVACIPDRIDAPSPMVYFQSAYHPAQEDSKMKQFVLDYVRFTKNESFINQHKIKNNRYDDLMLSKSLLAAVDLSVGVERMINQRRFKESSNQLKFLKENKVSFDFLVKSIIVQGIQGSGAARVIVRGKYQAAFDGAQIDMPTRYLGEREITYIITAADSVEDEQRTQNKYGYYVIDSFEVMLQPAKAKELDSRARKSYLTNN